MTERLRDAVRALVLDDDERVLLVRFEFPSWTGWATPGGGVNRDETDEEALRRELAEEAGLAGFSLGPMTWTRTHRFQLGKWDGQAERYYLVRTPAFEPVPALTWAELNAEFVTAVRWWTLEELEASAGEFAPGRLPLLARELSLNGPPRSRSTSVSRRFDQSTAEAIRDRRAPVATERLGPQLHARRRLTPLVLGPIDE